MVGAGHFIRDFGWTGFLLAAVVVMLVDYILGKFIESEKIRKVILYVIATLLAVLAFYLKKGEVR